MALYMQGFLVGHRVSRGYVTVKSLGNTDIDQILPFPTPKCANLLEIHVPLRAIVDAG